MPTLFVAFRGNLPFMKNYQVLLNVLDQIRGEARNTRFENTYLPADNEEEKVIQARSRAFVHLYLKVSFGLTSFPERENFVTDGTNDGGIDGYYLDESSKAVYMIQSKFRSTEDNFENKSITLDEITKMGVNRITSRLMYRRKRQ